MPLKSVAIFMNGFMVRFGENQNGLAFDFLNELLFTILTEDISKIGYIIMLNISALLLPHPFYTNYLISSGRALENKSEKLKLHFMVNK
jgi:hypothetical protein